MSAVTYHLDFETRSEVDPKIVGLDNYVRHPSTCVLMLAYACNDDLPHVWFPSTGPMPEELEFAIRRPEITKSAFNAQFERLILKHVLGIDTSIRAWNDCMIHARYASIAGDLAFVGDVLGLPEDKKKSARGRALIKIFCLPKTKKKKKKNPFPDKRFNDEESHPAEWAEFVEYCRQDVIAERAVDEKLKAFRLPPTEVKVFELDCEINERGLPTDPIFLANATKMVAEEKARLMEEAIALTGLENPNSVKQLLDWIQKEGYPYGSLKAPWLKQILEDRKAGTLLSGVEITDKCTRAIELRLQLAKSSTSKLDAVRNFVSADGRLRYQYVYGGAARTLRWSGRGAQPQNFPRPTIKDIEGGVEAILSGEINEVRKFGPVLEVIASCLRSVFRALGGKRFVVCDLASIETVVLAWLCNCQTLLDVFVDGRDAYVEFATRLFKKPYAELDPKVPGLTKEDAAYRKDCRQTAKPAVLGAGYGLGGGDFGTDRNGDEIKTGLFGYAANMGIELPRDTCHEAVAAYREAYPEVTGTWKEIETAAIEAVIAGEKISTNHVTFGAVRPNKLLYIVLPSGRRLHYIRPDIEEVEREGRNGPYTAHKLTYEGQIHIAGDAAAAGWGRAATWGGKLVENIVQAIARDLLVSGMLAARAMGFTIVGHAHDEIITEETEEGPLNLEKLRECMIARPAWGADIPTNADGFMDQKYRKG